MLNKRKEIGSEFWFKNDLPQPISEREGVYVLSGRTAIDLIIQDIQKTRKIQNVYMPAWCCDSMLSPFIDKGINVNLYDIRLGNQLEYLVDESKYADIFYVTNYFGYNNTISPAVIKHFKAKGSIIIYDRTHSFLMDDEGVEADYTFASIRKWMDVIDGAIVKGVSGNSLKQCPYLSSRIMAMRMKQAFINGDDTIDKQVFLNLYNEFGHHLEGDYRDYSMDDLSYAIYKAADISEMKVKRRENAAYLQQNLNLQFLAPLSEKACPLFVPVFFESKDHRDLIRKKLVEADIYCTVHWSKNQLITSEMEVNRIFDTELSLICDQRYGLSDMQHAVEVLSRLENTL